MTFFNHLIDLSLEAAPYLLFGLIIAGLIKAWLPESWVKRQLSGSGSKPIVKAALLGAPMPLCSCSVIPVALGIRRSGASKGSTVSFLVSTPETGVDSISLTYAMMGPFMAIVRPVAAIATALTAGLWVNASDSENSQQKPAAASIDEVTTSCCSKSAPAKPATSSCCSSKQPAATTTSSCCDSKSNDKAAKESSVITGIQFAFGKLYQDIAWWLLAGLVIAAAVQTFVPTEWLASWGSGWIAKFIMLVIGIPMYICASASTPIAAGLMLAGVSPGTVLVFLLAGPATNMSTIAVLRNELGQNIMIKYIVSVMAMALLSGVALDLLIDQHHIEIANGHQHSDWMPLWLSVSSLIILIAAAFKPIRDWAFDLLNSPSGAH
ncbi:SO_0444 family Cu/Zn efflux transporter [Neiella sp. HB171785]|uniref:SO_0444 family Cu/Zn efflux transporter n=1 Tax=Neiella litorisoli TaxID=2771431 RepID=A0A8J6UIV1_9GAMM|nr:SO_0444 family Cu/Zn efflux transporter [Neiella litorisoli]MBD1389178.1 SO_0444 family Cu/Zn efflux transporter [Neiella litorisoli]